MHDVVKSLEPFVGCQRTAETECRLRQVIEYELVDYDCSVYWGGDVLHVTAFLKPEAAYYRALKEGPSDELYEACCYDSYWKARYRKSFPDTP